MISNHRVRELFQSIVNSIIDNTSSVSSEYSSIYVDTDTNSSISNIANSTINSTNSTNTTDIEDNSGCELLGNFGYIVQGILGIMCFSVLVCK